MAAPSNKEFILFRSNANAWEERILLPGKGELLTFDADIEPVFTSGGTLTSTTSGITIDSGGENPVLVNTTIDIDTASGTTDGLLSSENWLTFDGKYDGLPTQTGQNGKFLTTDGISESWATVPTTSPAGSNTEIQYNNSSSFGASSNLAYTTGTNLNALKLGDCYIRYYDNGTTFQNLIIGDITLSGFITTSAKENVIIDPTPNTKALSSGDRNILLGNSAGNLIEGGNDNICVGSLSGSSLVNGGANVGIGGNALIRATGNYNIGIGVNTLFTSTTHVSDYNVAIGVGAGEYKWGDRNVYIGYNAGKTATPSDTEENDRLYIDNSNTTTPLIYGEFDNDYLKINGKLESTGVFKQKTFSQTSQPTTTDIPDGYSAYWVDTDDSNRTYLCYNLSGTILKVELT